MGLARGGARNMEDGALGKSELAVSSSSPKDSPRQAAQSELEKPDPSANALGESDSEQSRRAAATAVGVNEYPTGLRLVLLAGASIMGVFLISLDQVCTSRHGSLFPFSSFFFAPRAARR
jgi:hypothetical protein